MEKNYKFELDRKLPLETSRFKHYGNLVSKLVDECNDVKATYILCASNIVPILVFSNVAKMQPNNMDVFGPFLWGTLSVDSGDIAIIVTPNLSIGEIALCVGSGMNNLPLTSFDDYENRGKSIQEQFDKETIAYGIIK